MTSVHNDRVTAAMTLLDASTAACLAFLDQLPETLAVQALPERWTPAGHAAHVALTNNVFVGVLQGGGLLTAIEGTSDFPDEQWSMDVPPRGVIAPGILIPPSGIGRAAAAAQLRESVARLKPAIASLDETRAALCVRLPWNVVSVYQMTEWASGHTLRHLAQVNRDLQLAASRGMLGRP
jgi:hypothetical protein